MAEGASFISINPSTLEDSHYWSYADLRTLCKQLQLGANGKRVDLVDRLQMWHKARHEDGVAALSGSQFDEDAGDNNNSDHWLPMNVEGANFAILTQNVIMRNSSNDACEESKGSGQYRDENPETSMDLEEEDTFKKGKKSRRNSLRLSSISAQEQQEEMKGETVRNGSGKTAKGISPRSSTKTSLKNGSSSQKKMTFGFGETATIVSPTLLNPLVTMPGDTSNGGTPGKSILKRNPSSVSKDGGSATKINFSPFNGTKVIPHRVAHTWRKNREGVVIHEEEDEEDEDGDDDETFEDDPKELRRLGIDPILYVDREAKLNAEKNTELAMGPFLRTDSSDSDDLLWDRFDGL